jgi:drug/metabolite transporter (DMT)-like permease
VPLTPTPWLSWLAAAKLTTEPLTVQDIADGSVQVLAWVKYGAIYFAACLAARTDPAKADHSREQYILMAIIGLTDVSAYAANCLGVAFCGATRAALILAATQQVFTAVLSYILLGRRLSSQQVSGVRTWTHCSPPVLCT